MNYERILSFLDRGKAATQTVNHYPFDLSGNILVDQSTGVAL